MSSSGPHWLRGTVRGRGCFKMSILLYTSPLTCTQNPLTPRRLLLGVRLSQSLWGQKAALSCWSVKLHSYMCLFFKTCQFLPRGAGGRVKACCPSRVPHRVTTDPCIWICFPRTFHVFLQISRSDDIINYSVDWLRNRVELKRRCKIISVKITISAVLHLIYDSSRFCLYAYKTHAILYVCIIYITHTLYI